MALEIKEGIPTDDLLQYWSTETLTAGLAAICGVSVDVDEILPAPDPSLSSYMTLDSKIVGMCAGVNTDEYIKKVRSVNVSKLNTATRIFHAIHFEAVAFTETALKFRRAEKMPKVNSAGLLVHPEYRNRSIGYDASRLVLMRVYDYVITTQTTDPISSRIAQKLGFELIGAVKYCDILSREGIPREDFAMDELLRDGYLGCWIKIPSDENKF